MCRTGRNKAERYILPRVLGVMGVEITLGWLFAAVNLPSFAFLQMLHTMLCVVVYFTSSSMTALLYLYVQVYLAFQKINLVGSWLQNGQSFPPWQTAILSLQTLYSLLGAKWMLEAFNIFKYNSYN